MRTWGSVTRLVLRAGMEFLLRGDSNNDELYSDLANTIREDSNIYIIEFEKCAQFAKVEGYA